ncbi:MAG: phosphatase PAP2 family protein [Pseudomonadota bacterium]
MIEAVVFYRDPAWRWIPAIALALTGGIALSGTNIDLFLLINHAGEYLPNIFWEPVTLCGNTLLALALLTPWLGKKPYSIWATFLAAIPGSIFARLLKAIIDVPRPPAVLPDNMLHVIGPAYQHSSFPSGDALTIFVVMGIVWFTYRDWRVRTVALSFAILVAISRIAVGVHWPIDVLVGAAAGWTSAWIGVWAAPRWQWGATPAGRKFCASLLLVCALALFYQDMKLPEAASFRWIVATIATMLAARLLLWPLARSTYERWHTKEWVIE